MLVDAHISSLGYLWKKLYQCGQKAIPRQTMRNQQTNETKAWKKVIKRFYDN